MLQEIVLPRLGQTVEEAVIEGWRVKEGDIVRKGDILLEITTDKATLEVESYVEGTVLKIYAREGERVPVDSVIAYVGDPGADTAPAEPPTPVAVEEAPAAPPSTPAAAASPEAPPPPAAPAPAPSGRLLISPRARKAAEREKVTPLAVRGTGPNGRIVEADVLAYAEQVARLRVSPTARQIAYERGVDLLTVRGTGPGGRILRADVEKAPAAAPAPARRIEMTPARRIIGERMTQSHREAPHFYLQTDIDMTESVAFREALKAAGTRVSFNDLIIRAIAIGFREVPMMNAVWVDGGIAVPSGVDVCLAVALENGLVTPVVRGVEHLCLEEIAARTAELIEKARNKHLAPFEYEGGSITVSNLGMFGVGNFLPILNPGQASILGVGEIADRVVAVEGKVVVRKRMSVTLAVDHRIADGALAAAFLQAMKRALEAPSENLK